MEKLTLVGSSLCVTFITNIHTHLKLMLLGGFLRGQFDGEGVLTYPNGDIFKGMFSKGLKNGKGLSL